MEEQVGALWHRPDHAPGRQELPQAGGGTGPQVEKTVAFSFVRSAVMAACRSNAEQVENRARRSWLRSAWPAAMQRPRWPGVTRTFCACRRASMPAEIRLNRELYLWLAALAVSPVIAPG